MIGDWGRAIFDAFANAVNLILTFIPRILGFLVILAVGLIVATLVSKGLTAILRKVGFDRMAQRIGITRFEQRMGVKMDPAGLLGRIVYWFLLLIFLVPATDALGLPTVSSTINSLVAYIPNVFVAILVLFLGTLAATFVADLVRGATSGTNVGNPNIFAGIARWSIIGFAALIAFDQLQIGQSLVNILFIGIVGGLALAFALAFGLGGREFAQRMLARSENSMGQLGSAVSQYSSKRAAQGQVENTGSVTYAQPVYEQGTMQAAYPTQATPAQPTYQTPGMDTYPTQQTPTQPSDYNNMATPEAPTYRRPNTRQQ